MFLPEKSAARPIAFIQLSKQRVTHIPCFYNWNTVLDWGIIIVTPAGSAGNKEIVQIGNLSFASCNMSHHRTEYPCLYFRAKQEVFYQKFCERTRNTYTFHCWIYSSPLLPWRLRSLTGTAPFSNSWSCTEKKDTMLLTKSGKSVRNTTKKGIEEGLKSETQISLRSLFCLL